MGVLLHYVRLYGLDCGKNEQHSSLKVEGRASIDMGISSRPISDHNIDSLQSTQLITMSSLLQPTNIGKTLQLHNHVIMSALTRNRNTSNLTPAP